MDAQHLPDHRPFGTARVVEPQGVLPQQAWKLDASPTIRADEILCAVEWLNIDAASFRQIREATDGTAAAIGAHIAATVRERGKQHNAVTGSGGMFIGRVAEIGEAVRARIGLVPGDQIASLVSLTLTPLAIDEILEVDLARARLLIRGHAILVAESPWTKLPPDLPQAAALALFDVAGAPALVARHTKPGMTVLVVGADGKSGLLSCAAACSGVGRQGRVVGVVPDRTSPGARHLHDTGLAEVVEIDARQPLALFAAVSAVCDPLPDVVVNCVNVGGTEMGSILCTRQHGTLIFFSMATSFSAAALGAEGVGRDITMLIGNGYVEGHAQTAYQTLRSYPALANYFVSCYGTIASAQPSGIDSGLANTLATDSPVDESDEVS